MTNRFEGRWRSRRSIRYGSLWLTMAMALPVASAQTVAANGLADLTLEQLANVLVTSVTGRPEPAQSAAASIFVITAEDIRRSAATSLPEALRLAPNLQVARLNAGQYAISARGFNNAIGNKLLVLIDGRIVYSPLFSGVFWDEQDVVLQDIERIEVISGPGATLWGANAVNGVINVISKPAIQTQGLLAAGVGGRRGSQATARYGAALGDTAHFRIYATRLNRDNTARQDGVERADASSKEQVGFRADWGGASEQFTLQGDAYDAGRDSTSNLAPKLAGSNLLGRWKRQFADGSDWQLQAYYDDSRRDDDLLFRLKTRTAAVEFNHVPFSTAEQKVIWGAGYRTSRSEADPTRVVLFDPVVKQLRWANLFVQDELRVTDRTRVTLGGKLETNVYTGLEFLPTLRATYQLRDSSLVWGSLSRAVRAPARLDREFYFPAAAPFQIKGGPDFQSEVANVAEIGYRSQATERFSYSLTAFHHEYRRLRGGTVAPTFIENRVAGSVAGLEAWGNAKVTDHWRLSAGLIELRKSLRAAPGSSSTSATDLGNDPRHQWTVRSTLDLGSAVELDLAVRHVSSLPAPAVGSYTATDVRLAWQISPALSLTLLVQNLLDPGHIEFNAPAAASQIPRSAFVGLEWRTL